MELPCGCTDSCCGMCSLAKTAGRPRIDRENASDWKPPNLNKLKGASHRHARNADVGKPRLWFWQMTGERWDLDANTFKLEVKKWVRLAASTDRRGEPLQSEACAGARRSRLAG